jgi:hypothetical protein
MLLLKWERVQEMWSDENCPKYSTWRAQVPGGWLVTVWAGDDPKTHLHVNGGGLTFVPDPEHSWQMLPHTDPKK